MTHESVANVVAWQCAGVKWLQGAGWLIAVLGLKYGIDLS